MIRRSLLALVVTALPLTHVLAQATVARAPADTAAHNQSAWLSVGVGYGSPYPLVVRETINYSRWIGVATVSNTEAQTWNASYSRGQAILLGLRTTGTHVFVIGSLGYGRARTFRRCGDCDIVTAEPPRGGLAYAASAHLGQLGSILGMSLTASGVAEPTTEHYFSITLGLDAGNFRF